MKVTKKITKHAKCCYNCKHLYNSSTRKHCPNSFKIGCNPCDRFEFSALCKSWNTQKKR